MHVVRRASLNCRFFGLWCRSIGAVEDAVTAVGAKKVGQKDKTTVLLWQKDGKRYLSGPKLATDLVQCLCVAFFGGHPSMDPMERYAAVNFCFVQ